MANYEVTEGKRKGSKVYLHEDYRYVVHAVYKAHTRLRCCQYKSLLCQATAVIKDNRLTVIKNHTHDNDEKEVKILKMRQELKDAVAGSKTGDVKLIYDSVVGKYPPYVQVAVPWKNVKSRLYSIKRNMVTVNNQGEPGVRCHVCLGGVEHKWAFVPCGHNPFCAFCSGVVVEQKLPCPICRLEDVERMRLYDS